MAVHVLMNDLKGVTMYTIDVAKMQDKPRLAVLYEQLAKRPTILDKLDTELEQVLAKPEYRLTVARDADGKAVGTAMGVICHDLVGECQPFMVIENVVVDEALRGGGIGRKLMEDMERHARENDCCYVMFVSGATREDAHRFYEALGYELGRVRGFKKIL